MKASCIVVGDFAAVYPAGEVRKEFTAVTALERAEVAPGEPCMAWQGGVFGGIVEVGGW